MSNQAAFALFSNQSVASGASVTSEAVSLERSSGFFSLSGTITGTAPDIRIEYLSGNGANFVLCDTPIVDSQSATPFNIQFFPELAESIKVKVTNQSGSSATVSLTLRFTEA